MLEINYPRYFSFFYYKCHLHIYDRKKVSFELLPKNVKKKLYVEKCKINHSKISIDNEITFGKASTKFILVEAKIANLFIHSISENLLMLIILLRLKILHQILRLRNLK